MNNQLIKREDTHPRSDLEKAALLLNPKHGKNFDIVKSNLELHRLCRAVDKIQANKVVIELCKKWPLEVRNDLSLKYFEGDRVKFVYNNKIKDNYNVINTYLGEKEVDTYIRKAAGITTDDELYRLVNEAIVRESVKSSQSELNDAMQ